MVIASAKVRPLMRMELAAKLANPTSTTTNALTLAIVAVKTATHVTAGTSARAVTTT